MVDVIQRAKQFICEKLIQIDDFLCGDFTLTIIARHKTNDPKKSFFITGERDSLDNPAPQIALDHFKNIVSDGREVG